MPKQIDQMERRRLKHLCAHNQDLLRKLRGERRRLLERIKQLDYEADCARAGIASAQELLDESDELAVDELNGMISKCAL